MGNKNMILGGGQWAFPGLSGLKSYFEIELDRLRIPQCVNVGK